MSDQITELKSRLIAYNTAYRNGNPIVSDAEYDLLKETLEELAPNDELLNQVGIEIPDDDPRKQRLPIDMASMNKIKSYDELLRWMRLKNIPADTEFLLTAKLDGLSFCVNENHQFAWTRGDGVYGQRSDDHYKVMVNGHVTSPDRPFADLITFGEIIMKRAVFAEKYAELFENPRNLVAGVLNKKEPNEKLADLDFVRYGIVNHNKNLIFSTKLEQIQYLNKYQKDPVPYELVRIPEIDENYLKDLFAKWNQLYELDGIIVEVNDLELQKKLGRETGSNNPVYARAYKGNFEEVKETDYKGITWNVSKQGYLKPIIQIEPLRLDGVTVSNVTGNNAKFVIDMKIGKGSKLKVKRSGMVIPLIVAVTEESTEIELPTVCPSCQSADLGWNASKIEFICQNPTCSGQRLRQIISFFTTLDIENVSEGVCTQFYEAGYDTVHKILAMSREDMEKLERFGKRKAEIVYNAIHSKLKSVPLAKLQHATGLFRGLGSKKLALLEHFDHKPSFEEIIAVDGYSEISAKAYLEGYDAFQEFIRDLPLTIQKTQKVTQVSSQLVGTSFCFTGVRRKDLEEIIEQRGGKIASGVSKTLTYLVTAAKGSNSSKEVKATELGITILDVEDLEALLA
jgi:DNA ligase (NAD+)